MTGLSPPCELDASHQGSLSLSLWDGDEDIKRKENYILKSSLVARSGKYNIRCMELHQSYSCSGREIKVV